MMLTTSAPVELISSLVVAITALSGAVIYLYKSKEAAIKEKDRRILDVIDSHQRDLRDANNDLKEFVNKYHEFTQHLRDIVNGRTRK